MADNVRKWNHTPQFLLVGWPARGTSSAGSYPCCTAYARTEGTLATRALIKLRMQGFRSHCLPQCNAFGYETLVADPNRKKDVDLFPRGPVLRVSRQRHPPTGVLCRRQSIRPVPSENSQQRGCTGWLVDCGAWCSGDTQYSGLIATSQSSSSATS